jgi:hypothetical protein
VPENEWFALASVDPGARLGIKRKAAGRDLWTKAALLADVLR